MLKDILKNAGLLIILIGVVFLGLVVFNDSQTNARLGISLLLIVSGLLAHIALNKYLK